jgi:flagellin
MGLRINTNMSSVTAQRQLSTNMDRQKSVLEKLSSGSRINRAGDDAAGLAISDKLKSQIKSMRQAQRNINDGISLVQVAEGAMNEVSNILIRLRELSVQAASDTIGDREREFLNREVVQLKSEINRISETTEFDGIKLLNNQNHNVLEFQVGINNNPSSDRLLYEVSNLTTTLETLNITNISTETKERSQLNLNDIDEAINHLSQNRSTIGALQNRMQSTLNNLTVYRENLESAHSRIRDADMAEESSNLVKENILMQTSLSVLAQANSIPQYVAKLIN